MCPPSQNCAPKKVTDFVPLECSLGSEIPKTLIINRVFVGKKPFFANFAMNIFFHLFIYLFLAFISKFEKICASFAKKTFFLVFTLGFERKMFLCPPKFIYAPQSRYSGAEYLTNVLNNLLEITVLIMLKLRHCDS